MASQYNLMAEVLILAHREMPNVGPVKRQALRDVDVRFSSEASSMMLELTVVGPGHNPCRYLHALRHREVQRARSACDPCRLDGSQPLYAISSEVVYRD